MTQADVSVALADYLHCRLAHLGIQSVHGSTGLVNPIAQAASNASISYIGSCNEAHAAFAADAYARIKGVAALLSAYGTHDPPTNQVLLTAHAEHIPIIHLVTYPAIGQDEDRATLRHMLRQGQVGSIDQAVAYNSVVVLGVFEDVSDAGKRIDDALSDCVFSRRPVYIGVPLAFAGALVDAGRLGRAICCQRRADSGEKEEHVAEVILRYIDSARDPVIIVDGGVIRQRLQAEVQQFVVQSGLPTFVTIPGKHAIDAIIPNHGGLYAGLQLPDTKARVDASDLVIHIGPVKSHVNARYLHYLQFANKIELNIDEHLVGRTMSYGLSARDILTAINRRLDEITLAPGPIPQNKTLDDPIDRITLLPEDDGKMTITGIYPRVMTWMRGGDILINHFPTDNLQNWTHHTIWERRDVSFGACLGACVARHLAASTARVLMFVDEQYCHHVPSELSTIRRLGLAPILFILRNPPIPSACSNQNQNTGSDTDSTLSTDSRLSLLAAIDPYADIRVDETYQWSSVYTRRDLSEILGRKEVERPSCLQIVEVFVYPDSDTDGTADGSKEVVHAGHKV